MLVIGGCWGMKVFIRIGEYGFKFRFWNIFGIIDFVGVEVKVYVEGRE